MAEMDLKTFLHSTQIRPNLTLIGCFFSSLGLYNIKNIVLKGLFQVVLKFQFDATMIYQPLIIVTFKVDLGSVQESCCGVAILIQCMKKHGPERI